MTDLKSLEDRIAPEAALVSTEEARRLFEHAEASSKPPFRKQSAFYSVRSDQESAALVAAVTCFALHGDTSAIRLAKSALEMLVRRHWFGDHVRHAAGSLTELVRRLPSDDDSIAELASASEDLTRKSLANGLSNRTDRRSLEVLVALAGDESAEVRMAARASLPKDHLPAWHGLFSDDPLPRALAFARAAASRKSGSDGASKAERKVTELIARICEAFAKGDYEASKATKEIAPKGALLPDELVVDLARHVVRAEHRSDADPILLRALGCEGGASLLVELATRWADRGTRNLHVRLAKTLEKTKLSVKTRAAIAWGLLREATREARTESARENLSELAEKLLPPSEANTLADWLGDGPTGEERHDRPEIVRTLYPLLSQASPDRLADWAVRTLEDEARYASYWTHTLASRVLADLPMARRLELAIRYAYAEASGDITAKEAPEGPGNAVRRRWAIEQLLDGSYDESTLGPKEALAAKLFADAASRTIVFTSRSLPFYVLPLARRALVRGELTYEEALVTVRAVRAVFEGIEVRPHLIEPKHESFEATLGTPEERVPLTLQERAAYMQLRATRFATDRETLDLDVVGTESAEGRARIESLIEAAIALEPKAIEAFVREIYITEPTPDIVREAASRILDAAYDPEYTGPAASEINSLRYGLETCEPDGREKRAKPSRPEMASSHAAQRAFLDAANARTLLDRATDAFYADVLDPRMSVVASWHAQASAVLASASCVLHGVTSSTKLIAAGLQAEFLDHKTKEDLGSHLAKLVGLSPSTSAHVRALANDETAAVRLAVAEGLDPNDPTARDLLTKLVRDPQETVRNAARAALGEGALPWWMGVFSRDPSETLSEEEEARLLPVLREIVSALGPQSGEESRVSLSAARIRKLSLTLPANLACELATSQGRALEDFHAPSPWIAPILGREGGEDTFFALLSSWSTAYFYHKEVAAMIASLPKETRRRYLCRTLKLALEDDDETPLGLYALVTDAAKTTDVETVALELLTFTEHESFGKACEKLNHWFTRQKSIPRCLSEWSIVELRKPHEDLDARGGLAEDIAWKLPPAQLRPVAFEALGSTSRPRRRWALRAVLTRCHSTALDGPKAARVKAFFDDPTFRTEMIHDPELLDLCLPLARAELVERRLDFDSAFHVAEAAVGGAFVIRPGKEGQRPRTEPPKLTAEELDAYLYLREGHSFERSEWHPQDLHVIEGAPDVLRAHLARALEAVRAGDADASEAVGVALYGKPTETVFETGKLMAEVYAETGLPTLLDMGMRMAYVTFGEPIPKWYRERRDDFPL